MNVDEPIQHVVMHVLFGIALVIDALAAWGVIYYARLVRLIKKTPTLPIKDVKKGYAEVKGRVVATGNTLHAPLSDKPCVYYHLVIKEKLVTGRVDTVIDDKRSSPWVLSDDSGLARVDLTSAKLALSATHRVSTISGNSPEKAHLEEVLKRYGTKGHRWTFEKGLEFEETILQEGAELHVLGSVRFDRSRDSQRSGLPSVYFSRKRGPLKAPFIVSDKSEKQTLTEQRWQLFGFAILFLVVSFGAIIYVQ